jgi:hypothetical protein
MTVAMPGSGVWGSLKVNQPRLQRGYKATRAFVHKTLEIQAIFKKQDWGAFF